MTIPARVSATFMMMFLLAACKPGFQVKEVLSGNSDNNSSAIPGDGPGTSPGDKGPDGDGSEIGSPGGDKPGAVDLASLGDIDLFKEIAEPMGQSVDRQYSSNRELMKVRSTNSSFMVDKCDPIVQTHDRFADRIAYGVFKRMQPTKVDMDSSVAPLFGLNKDYNTYVANGLLTKPFCKVTEPILQKVFEGHRVPTAEVIAKAQRFTELLNQYRSSALSGSRDGKVKAYKLWTKFMMCLGYMESLTTADAKSGDVIADAFGFDRPAGVSFFNDSNQTAADSVLAIGIFQESNVVKDGDTYSCVTDWNRQFPSCQISTGISKTGMVTHLGSAYQTFNAYCGAAYITRMFSVQINSTRAKNTHPDNIKSDGSLKAPADRCVSPFMNVNTSYNHFAPLQNGSGFTLDNILTCTLAAD